MSLHTDASRSVMAADGYYNRHSERQAQAAEMGTGWLAEAAAAVPLPDALPVAIADYGSAQGRNSMAPMRAAVEAVRSRSDAQIEVIHTDLPANDFATLFRLFEEDHSSYLRGFTEVYPYAIGRSFYKPLFPTGTLHLGWSCVSTHWLSHVPRTGIRALMPALAAPEDREAFARQAADDWSAFLTARAQELDVGGRVVMVQPCAHPDGTSGGETLARVMAEVRDSMVEDGRLPLHVADRMLIPAWMRTVDEYVAPIDDHPHLRLLRIEVVDQLPDPDRARLLADRDVHAYAHSVAASARAWSEHMLFGEVDDDGVTADEFYRRLEEEIAAHPGDGELPVPHLLFEFERTERR
ncbi:MAG: hypothetical protein ACOYOP_15860 [Microthrixaceae bacterium]